MYDEPQGVIWVCQCCMLEHANGECCEMHSMDPRDLRDEPDPQPWSLGWKPGEVTMGMLPEEHHESCHVYKTNGEDRDECDCEGPFFSWSSCEGCGSPLGGDRHAFTWWS